jgi:multicomponent Na+:H+ antiporter subunit E
VLAAFRGFLFALARIGAGEVAARALHAPVYALVTGRELLVGTWRVGRAVLSRRPVRTAGVVTVPMGARTDTGVAVSALAISLTPGELVLELDWDRRLMLVHTLDAHDPEGVRRAQARLYERYQRRVFP